MDISDFLEYIPSTEKFSGKSLKVLRPRKDFLLVLSMVVDI